MKKSLFGRFFVLFLSVVLGALLLLGSVVIAFSGNYVLGQNKKLLLSGGETIATQIENAAYLYSGQRLTDYAYQMSSVLAKASGYQVLIINDKGMPVACVGNQVSGTPVHEQVFQKHLQTTTAFVGKLDGGFTATCVIAATPLVIDGTPRGVIYTAMPAGTVGTYMKHLMQGLSIAAGLMVAVMAAGAFVFARALTRPLEQMSAAAKGLAQGDFSRRIAVSRQDEIGQLAMAFNDMSASLEAGEKMRRGFVANVSHELKSPMTTIGGFVDGMLDGTIPPELHNRYLAVVSEEVKRLSRLVNRMLNLSKIESGEILLHPAPINLTQLVLQSVFLYESKLTEQEITVSGLDTLPPLPVTADPDLMEQVVRNLLDNGVKYTPPGGQITLGGEETEDTVRLWIRNTCEGIDEENLPFVFDRFFKADASRGADKQSLGLGLYLVKTILSLHGGLVTVRSVKDAYCEFEILMPSRKGE